MLDPDEKPRDRQWYPAVSLWFCFSLSVHWFNSCLSVCLLCRYVVVATGAAPGVSVGHTCTFLPSSDGGKGRIVVVGGANPDGSFSDSHMINLGNNEFRLESIQESVRCGINQGSDVSDN